MGSIFAPKLSAEQMQVLVDAVKSHILQHCTPRSIRLFGSAARGTMNQASDIDVAIILSDAMNLRETSRSVCCAPRDFFWPVDFLFYRQSEFNAGILRGGTCQIIAEEGQIIWEHPDVTMEA